MLLPLKLMMRLLLLMLAMTISKGQDQDFSVSTDIDCRCSSDIMKDHLGRDMGRCMTKVGGKHWCYVPVDSTCSDKKQSKRDTELYWSHKACDLYRARDIDFNVELPSVTRDEEYVIDLEHWDIPNNREDHIQTTKNLQKAIDWANDQGYGKVRLPDGHYLVGVESPSRFHGFSGGVAHRNNISMVGIELHSNTEFILDQLVTLEMVANDKPIYCIICIKDKNDIIIRSENSGGILKGDRDDHIFTNHIKTHGRTHEWGHGIVIQNNFHRILVKDMTLKDFTGDGVYIVTKHKDKSNGTDVTVVGNNIHNNRRQGISIVGGLRVNITDNEIHNINGTSPRFGIDIEGPGRLTKDIIISKNYFHENLGGDVVNTNGENVFITDNIMVQGTDYTNEDYRKRSDAPIVTWHYETYQVIANNNITMYNRTSNGLLGYIEYFRRKSKKHNHVTYVHDNYCQGCGMFMKSSSNANIQRNKFIGYFLGLHNFTNAVLIDNHVQVPAKQDECIWSYWITSTAGRARGNTYATHKHPDKIKLYDIPLSDEPWTRDRNSCPKDD